MYEYYSTGISLPVHKVSDAQSGKAVCEQYESSSWAEEVQSLDWFGFFIDGMKVYDHHDEIEHVQSTYSYDDGVVKADYLALAYSIDELASPLKSKFLKPVSISGTAEASTKLQKYPANGIDGP